VTGGLRRRADVVRMLRLARRLGARERWPHERLRQFQQDAVDAVVRDAIARSRLHRERLGPRVGPGPVNLRRLPVLDKATLMERFDDLVTDPRLRRDELLAHLDGLDHDALLFGDYRVMATSGSSGAKGVFVQDRATFAVMAAQLLRFNAMAGVRPRLPRLKVAAVVGGSPTHMSRRVSAMLGSGPHRVLPLPASAPTGELVATLNAHRPDVLAAYPSVAVALAAEQEAGRLRIAPARVLTSSELCTAEMADRLTRAFGVRPFDLYATTEGLWGGSCDQHAGVHLFEDVTVVENVDEDGRPVPDGERGAKLLVTSLVNRVQPLIRLELRDVVTLDPEPCPCGRTLRRLRVHDGRADDVLRLPGRDGEVVVHPLAFAMVTADRAVREFQVVQSGDRLRLRVTLLDGAPEDEVAERLRTRVGDRLAALGVARPHVDVEACDAVERRGGKVRLVVADR
jgi:phenylacetate-coenzyme A ligase PaaK-like adenylate-forming protein